MKVLHLFQEYLPMTMIWAFQQIRNTRGVEVYIAGLIYLPNSYHDQVFHYWPNPISQFSKVLQWGLFFFLRRIKGFHPFLGLYLRRKRIDVLHCHFGNIGADFVHLGKRFGLPVVVSFYGFDYEMIFHDKPRYRKAYNRMFQQVDAVICEGPHAAQKLESLGCPSSKIHQIPLGVNVEAIPVLSRTKISGQLRLVQVASITPKKGHLFGLDALKIALDNGLDITLDYYGPIRDKALAKKIQERIQEPPFKNKVQLLEPIPYDHLHDLLGKYQVFYHPSIHGPNGDCEGGAPISILDAQATAMPVIATRHCDIPFEVEHGQTGLLGAENDAGELAAHLATFAQMDQNAYDVFCIQARRKIETAFQVERGAGLLAGLYRELLNR